MNLWNGAEAAKKYIEEKISKNEWSSNKFLEITIEKSLKELSMKSKTTQLNLKRKFEIYPAKRMAIGLRSIEAGYEEYKIKAQIVSKPFDFNYNIKNLTISADTSFNLQDNNSNKSYIKYYISLDKGKKWIQISPIENPFNGVPEILSFNENTSSLNRIKGIAYFNSPDIPVETNSVTVKIEIEKPKYENTTPIIYSYQISARVEKL